MRMLGGQDEVEMASATAGKVDESGREQVFVLDRPRSFFADLCAFLPVVVFVLLFLPHCRGPISRWIAIGLGAAMAITGAFTVFERRRTIRLTEKGISYGRRSLQWEDIKSVRKWFLRFTPVVLESESWWYPPLRLPPHPLVYRQVLPELLRRRPDLDVSSRVRRAIESPEGAIGIPRWAALLMLASAVTIGLIPLFLRFHSHNVWLSAYAAYTFLSMGTQFATLSAHSKAELFARETASLHMGLVGLSPGVLLVADVPMHSVDALMAMVCVLLLASAAIVGLRLSLGMLQKLLILVLMACIPAGIHAYGASRALTRTNITHVVGTEMRGPDRIWAKHDNLAVGWLADGEEGQRHLVVSFSPLKATPLPLHQGSQITAGLNSRAVVRRITSDGNSSLYLYRFAEGNEVRLSSGGRVVPMTGQCISPDGRTVCWLEWDANDALPLVRTADLDRAEARTLSVNWPEDPNVRWQGCRWAGSQTLIVQGLQGDDPNDRAGYQALHLLRVALRDGQSEHVTTSRRFRQWRLSPDAILAFAEGFEGRDQDAVHLVELRTERTKRLGRGLLPVWQADGQCAFWLTDPDGKGTALCRIDPRRGTQQVLLRMPAGMGLAWLSPRGRFALLERTDRATGSVWLVNVATAERRRVRMSLLSAIFFDVCLPGDVGWKWFPALSIWSRDERFFILQMLDLPTSTETASQFRTYLYHVPQSWLAQ